MKFILEILNLDFRLQKNIRLILNGDILPDQGDDFILLCPGNWNNRAIAHLNIPPITFLV